MRNVLVIAMVWILATPSAALAMPQNPISNPVETSDRPPGLRAAAIREAGRLARAAGRSARQTERRENGNWIRRHPAAFGAALGAGAGVVMAVSNSNSLFCTGNDEDCLAYGGWGVAFGAAVGAGVGFLAGHFVGGAITRDQGGQRSPRSHGRE